VHSTSPPAPSAAPGATAISRLSRARTPTRVVPLTACGAWRSGALRARRGHSLTTHGKGARGKSPDDVGVVEGGGEGGAAAGAGGGPRRPAVRLRQRRALDRLWGCATAMPIADRPEYVTAFVRGAIASGVESREVLLRIFAAVGIAEPVWRQAAHTSQPATFS